MSGSIRRLLKDQRGATSTAVAALFSIAVILVLMSAMSSPKGAEDVFWAEFAIAKCLAGLLGIDEYLKPFEEMLKDLQGSELWPLIVSILSMVCMVFSLLVAFAGTKAVVGTTTRVLTWRRGRREKRKKIIEEDRRQYELWREGFESEDEEADEAYTILPAIERAIDGLVTNTFYMSDNANASAKDSITKERERIGELYEHKKAKELAKVWLKKEGQSILLENKSELDPQTGEPLSYYGRPDYSTELYIVECKRGALGEAQHSRLQALKFIRLIIKLKEKGVKKTLVYWFYQHPSPDDKKWREIINILEKNGALLKYGDE